ncbi:MAG: SDR family oxidoreductase [Pseudomonadota bacterium]|nr:SDR family oxidoreductase [Burkholderiaceae bacterium]MDQ3446043.1 SDR family oxidoreductase [Pseudomonadota bacterium]
MSLNVFITGASSGIGAALANEFATRGACLGLVARRRDALDAVEAALPGKHHTYVADVTDREALIGTARAFDAAVGGTDIVIANAGISIGVKTEFHEDLEQFARVMDTNVLGMAATFHPFIAGMKARRRGTLVGIASVAGVRGLPGSDAYCASKAAAIVYCESLRVEMAKHGIKVVTIAPGFIRTSLTRKNPYQMPFLMDADAFAQRAADAIVAGVRYRTIPWQMGGVSSLLKLMPRWLFDRLMSNRKQKPRAGDA